jgi:hypothetical protein
MIQRPRYLIATILMWVALFVMKLYDDYDGIMSWIGAPIVATFLLAVSLPILLVLGLVRRVRTFASFWYSGTANATIVLVASLIVLIFGHALGIREAYTYTNSLGDTITASRLHSFVSLPAFFMAAFSVLYWPAAATSKQRGEQAADGKTHEAPQPPH